MCISENVSTKMFQIWKIKLRNYEREREKTIFLNWKDIFEDMYQHLYKKGGIIFSPKL